MTSESSFGRDRHINRCPRAERTQPKLSYCKQVYRARSESVRTFARVSILPMSQNPSFCFNTVHLRLGKVCIYIYIYSRTKSPGLRLSFRLFIPAVRWPCGKFNSKRVPVFSLDNPVTVLIMQHHSYSALLLCRSRGMKAILHGTTIGQTTKT